MVIQPSVRVPCLGWLAPGLGLHTIPEREQQEQLREGKFWCGALALVMTGVRLS